MVLNARAGQAPAELGIALDQKALDGLPTSGMMYRFDLEFPAQSPAPYRFAELDWNPHGHEPPGIYTVPHMGLHWSDVRSPELQGALGHPESYRPFTKTFIYGSWDGNFTFLEPMVTIEYLQSHPDAVSPISVPARYAQSGWYPTSYRVTYDAQAKEYRVALSGMVQH